MRIHVALISVALYFIAANVLAQPSGERADQKEGSSKHGAAPAQ